MVNEEIIYVRSEYISAVKRPRLVRNLSNTCVSLLKICNQL